MPGSRRWFQYVDDAAVAYAMEQDEGNGLAVGNDLLASQAPTLPKRLRPRHVMAEWVHTGTVGEGTGISKRKIVVGKIADYNALTLGGTLTLPEYQSVPTGTPTTPNVEQAFIITAKVPERLLRGPRLVETGMDEG